MRIMQRTGFDARQLEVGVDTLNQLALEEYGMSLMDVLTDSERSEDDRLWRVGRLMGIELKKPFATPAPIDASFSKTNAKRMWKLDDAAFTLPEKQETWQYMVLGELTMDEELHAQMWLGPSASVVAADIIKDFQREGIYKDPNTLANKLQGNFASDVDTAKMVAEEILKDSRTIAKYADLETLTALLQEHFQHNLIQLAAQEMQSERGFFRCLALSAHKYLCGNEELRQEIGESLAKNSGASVFASPQALIGASAVLLANALIQAIPWLNMMHQSLVVGFVILIGNVSLDGFCTWITDYVRVMDFPDAEV